jgi:site-specific DNA-methyltransferase (cytosine-N4-specific)
MSQAHYIVADVFEALAAMPDNSVDLILTSPPFLALRSYLPADHPDKGKEIGSEPSPAAFLDTLLDLTVEWRRVLAPHGSLCVELGDTYAGSGGAGGDYGPAGMREGAPAFDGSATVQRVAGGDERGSRRLGATPYPARKMTEDWPLPKSLCGIPELYRLSLAYGRNMLRPERLIEPWRVRNVIRWCRPNPPVGALGDKFRPATSDMVVACTSGQRWFDLDAVRQPLTEHFDHKQRYPMDRYAESGKEQNESRNDNGKYMGQPNPAGAPPLDWWQVSTEPYAGSHYATWPRALLTRPIQAMCPTRVCVVCGEPSRRIVAEQQQATEREALAVFLRTAREAKGLTVKEVAKHFPSRTGGLTGCVANWEGALNVPTAEQWPVLKQLLDLGTEFDAVISSERRWTESTAEHEPVSGRNQRGLDRRDQWGVNPAGAGFANHEAIKRTPDRGWTDCGHDNWRTGITLDPFAGSGTTLAVATGHGRDAIGIDLDSRNLELARERVGPMWFTEGSPFIEGAA